MAEHVIVIEYSEHGPPEIRDAPRRVRPGDTIILSVRDYSPPPECYDDVQRDEEGAIIAGSITVDEDGSEYYEDASTSIDVVP